MDDGLFPRLRFPWRMFFGGGGGTPEIPAPKPPKPPVTGPTEAELARLAKQRKSLETKRKGRRSLRIDVNPGLSAGNDGGMKT